MAPTISARKPGNWPLIEGINLDFVDAFIWPMLFAFIILGFLDSLTTLLAYASFKGFTELNTFAASFFRLGLIGFLLAEVTKDLPVFPLAYMASLRKRGRSTDDQVALLRLTALIVLAVADAYLVSILLLNNFPGLIGALS